MFSVQYNQIISVSEQRCLIGRRLFGKLEILIVRYVFVLCSPLLNSPSTLRPHVTSMLQRPNQLISVTQVGR